MTTPTFPSIPARFQYSGGSIQNTSFYNPDGSRPVGGGIISLTNSFLYLPITDGGGATFNGFLGIDLLGDLPTNTNLYLFANGVHGATTLYTANGSANNGTLVIRTANGYSGTIQVDDGSGTFTNNGNMIFTDLHDAGVIQMNGVLVNNGHIGAYDTVTLNAHTINNGTFDVGANSSLSIINATFDQNAGSLGNDGSTSLTLYNSTFNYNGGIVYLTLDSYGNSSLKITAPDGQGLAFNAYDRLNLIGNLPAHTTLYSIADGVTGGATLAVQNNASNSGNITLIADDGFQAELDIAEGAGVFNNLATLNLHTDNSSSVLFFGAFVNRGVITDNVNVIFDANVANEASFNVNVGASLTMNSARFNQDAGYLGNSGAAVHFTINNGTFNYNGGVVYTIVDLYSNSVLSTAVADGNGAGFNAYGDTTLHGNFAANTTLVSIANGVIGGGDLYVDGNATNRGHIYIAAAGGYSNTLFVNAENGNFNNAGTLTFSTDNISNALVVGALTNTGSVFVQGSTYFYGSVYNYGSMTITQGNTAYITDGQTLYQDGALEIDGSLNLGINSQIIPGPQFSFLVGGRADLGSNLSVGSGNSLKASGAGANASVVGTLSVGGQIVAQGGGNIVAQGGGNIVAQGGGNVISNDGGSIVAQGGGNIMALGGGNIVAQGGGNIVAQGGGNAVVQNGLLPAAQAGPTRSIIANANGTITLACGNLIADNALEIDANGTLTGYGNVTVATATAAGSIIAANGTLTVNAPLIASGGTLGGPTGLLLINGQLSLLANTSIQGPVEATSLSLANAAILDLAGNKFILTPAADTKSAAYASLQTELVNGSLLSSTLPPHTALALLDNALTNFTTFGGLPVTTNSLLLAPELLGDTNLDGTVNATDLNTVLAHLGTATPNWTSGNFDNAPTIDLTDLNTVLNHLGQSLVISTRNTIHPHPRTNLPRHPRRRHTPPPSPPPLSKSQTASARPQAAATTSPLLVGRSETQARTFSLERFRAEIALMHCVVVGDCRTPRGTQRSTVRPHRRVSERARGSPVRS